MLLLLLCFTSLFFSMCCRRRPRVLPTCFRYIVCCCRRRRLVLPRCFRFIVSCRRCRRVLPFKYFRLPVNLFSSSSYFRSISWCRSDESGSPCGSIDVECLAYLAFLPRFCFRSLLSNPPFILRMRIEMRSNRSVVTSQVNHVVDLNLSFRVFFFLNVVLSAT